MKPPFTNIKGESIIRAEEILQPGSFPGSHLQSEQKTTEEMKEIYVEGGRLSSWEGGERARLSFCIP